MHIAMKRSNLNARKLDFEEELIIILISALSGTEDNAESNSLTVGLVIYWLYQPGLCRWISNFFSSQSSDRRFTSRAYNL